MGTIIILSGLNKLVTLSVFRLNQFRFGCFELFLCNIFQQTKLLFVFAILKVKLVHFVFIKSSLLFSES